MGSCVCCQTVSNLELQRSETVKSPESTVQIPQMHPKVHVLADRVLHNQTLTVTNIDLSGRDLGEEGGKYLGAIIPYYHHITSLILSKCYLEAGAFESIASALTDLVMLKELDFSFNNIGSEGADILSPALERMGNLEILGLEEVGLGSNGMLMICSGIVGLRHLKELYIGKNNIGDVGIRGLANIFPYICSLATLEINKNGIGPKGMAFLASSLGCLKNLTKFNVGENNLLPIGVSMMIPHLPRSLESLVIDKVGADNSNIMKLTDILSEFSKLKHLSLDHNEITSEGVEEIIKILPKLKLSYLGLIGCDISSHRKALSLAGSSTEVLL
ncbi:unnamed protein product [Blepharisma stoltei]|uniref:Uncharacterized protein n=1 Tax=Blepharisma stoltei TaxID=1481888 RepID=A0AAU9KQ22_9CILI|nr:unnamed protein product [Blepharisma stoltei]